MFTVTEAKGHLGMPCLPSNQCRDINAACTRGVCICMSDFFENNGICCKLW